MRSLLLLLFTLTALLTAEEADEDDPPPLTEDQRQRAEKYLTQLTAEDELAADVAPPPGNDGLTKDDRLLLQALSFDLMEAERWVERGDAAFAGRAFLRYNKQRKALDEATRERLAGRLAELDERQLALARTLLGELEVPAPVEEEPGQDDGGQPSSDAGDRAEEVRSPPDKASQAEEGR